jgi:hypothetical protein
MPCLVMLDNSAVSEIGMYMLQFLVKITSTTQYHNLYGLGYLGHVQQFSHSASTPENSTSPYLSFSSHAYLRRLLKVQAFHGP